MCAGKNWRTIFYTRGNTLSKMSCRVMSWSFSRKCRFCKCLKSRLHENSRVNTTGWYHPIFSHSLHENSQVVTTRGTNDSSRYCMRIFESLLHGGTIISLVTLYMKILELLLHDGANDSSHYYMKIFKSLLHGGTNASSCYYLKILESLLHGSTIISLVTLYMKILMSSLHDGTISLIMMVRGGYD